MDEQHSCTDPLVDSEGELLPDTTSPIQNFCGSSFAYNLRKFITLYHHSPATEQLLSEVLICNTIDDEL